MMDDSEMLQGLQAICSDASDDDDDRPSIGQPEPDDRPSIGQPEPDDRPSIGQPDDSEMLQGLRSVCSSDDDDDRPQPPAMSEEDMVAGLSGVQTSRRRPRDEPTGFTGHPHLFLGVNVGLATERLPKLGSHFGRR